MKLLSTVTLLITSTLCSAAFAQVSDNFSLSDYKWKNRVLLVFSPNTFNSDYREQTKSLKKADSGIKERDLKIFYVLRQTSASAKGNILTDDAADALRSRFSVNRSDFTTILIGKDGTEKLRTEDALSTEDLFDEIDSMPMRKLEMKDDGGN